MNRRDFLSSFAQTVAGAAIVHTLDVDKLLWVAGERTIFLPPTQPELFNMDDWRQQIIRMGPADFTHLEFGFVFEMTSVAHECLA